MKKSNKICILIVCILCLILCGKQTSLLKGAASWSGLKITPNASQNSVKLAWTAPDKTNKYSYMIYQKTKGVIGTSFQTIPAKGTVRVLQIYPYTNQLVGWVNAYGQGKITCDAVPIGTFNSNPNIIWNYDVIVFGFWDCNYNYSDISAAAVPIVKKYADQGYGVLFGHDTNAGNFANLQRQVGITYGSGDPNWSEGAGEGISKVIIEKKGLLTNYPYQIGDVGTELSIPFTHTSGQLALQDIWMSFRNKTNRNYKSYLSTSNNIALIQTGHSDGAATLDEQRLLMNTLYYLAQKTEATSWEDHMGQDLAAPETPILHDIKTDTDNQTITLSMSSKDKGSTYQYYIEATNLATSAKLKSNTAETYTCTGLAGYSIVVDQQQNTIPDLTIESQSDVYTLRVDGNYVLSEPVYVHIRAIDKAGNGSVTTHESFTYSKPLVDYDGQLNFNMNEFQKVEIKIAVSNSSMNLSDFKTKFYAELEKRGVKNDTFSIQFVSYSTNQQFMNLLEGTAWTEGSQRFLLHMADSVSFFSDSSLWNQVLLKTKKEQIHYIGLGKTSVQVNTLKFVIANENRGYYIYSGNSGRAVLTLVDYLIWKITFPEGNGTKESPFLIRRGDQFYGMKYIMNGYFELAQDVDMHGICFQGVGDVDNPFTGHLDGKGYIIGNFTMRGEESTWDKVGLFRVSCNADIQNIILNDVTIIGGKYVGGLIGYAYGSEMKIYNCEIREAVIQGESAVGGLIGYLEDGTITSCSSTASVYGKYYVGGVIGHSVHTIIRDVVTLANVTGIEQVGGILGFSDRNRIVSCESYANMVGKTNVGGLLGYHNGTPDTNVSFTPLVQECESFATVKADQNGGGIVGYLENGELVKCTSFATMEGNEQIGDLIGYEQKK